MLRGPSREKNWTQMSKKRQEGACDIRGEKSESPFNLMMPFLPLKH